MLAAERARLREAVLGLIAEGGDEDYWEGWNEHRAAVVALFEPYRVPA